MKIRRPVLLALLSFSTVMLAATFAAPLHAAMFATDNFTIYGDFRARLEQDWDSQKSSGSEREDRLRARIRARIGIKYKPNEIITFNTRLRTGSDDSQQSPHITVLDFDDNDTGDANVNFDKWYLKAKKSGLWGWIGRNGLPVWKPNEMFWDDDVTPVGIAAGYDFDLGGGKLGVNAGYFSLPAGMHEFCGNMGHGQLVFKTSFNDVKLTAAGGVFGIEKGSAGDEDCGIYQQNNGMRDYTIWVGNLQTKFNVGGKPLAVGIDYMHNSEDYDAADPGDFVTTTNENETDGWDVYIKYGNTKKKGNMLLGYWYAKIEQFAVNNSFAQDDWVRWGSATQTRASNMKGHEIRVVYGLGGGMNLVARLYLVEAITSVEDGNRFRLDYNIKF